eukprot:TRINITY_DN3878_c0_g1_i2.p1 TRINITY_DN3878_c0_g1~~TRINITY_DN3878_c0_g1_i2.p1  ORF type:complete len:412 (+),score=90.81 TRINITY_DN3878_c0_g1_i2:200-1435(+)
MEWPFHSTTYASRPDVRAIVHGHAPAVLACASCHKPVPLGSTMPHASSLLGDAPDIPVLSYLLPGSDALAKQVGDAFGMGREGVLLANHGLVCVGSDMKTALQRYETCEFACRSLIRASQFGAPLAKCSTENLSAWNARKRRIAGEFAQSRSEENGASRTSKRYLTWMQSFKRLFTRRKEHLIRKELCKYVHRGYKQRLYATGWGHFSARVSKNAIVMTPDDADFNRMSPSDLIYACWKGETWFIEKKLDVLHRSLQSHGSRFLPPPTIVECHSSLYRKMDGISAIFETQTPNIGAFSLTHTPFDTELSPEGFLVLRDVPLISLREYLRPRAAGIIEVIERKNLRSSTGKLGCGVLVENVGVVMMGTSLHKAFDQLEVMDALASMMVDAKSLGGIKALLKTSIEEIRKAFF